MDLHARKVDSHAQAPRSLELREGAQVMLTRNANPRRGLVNGARGIVQRFAGTANRLPVVRFASVRDRLLSVLHLPLSGPCNESGALSCLPLHLSKCAADFEQALAVERSCRQQS